MQRRRFGRMLRWAVAAPVALLTIVAITFLVVIQSLMNDAAWVDHTDRVISTAQRTQALIIDMETAVRGFLLTGHPAFLTPYRGAERQVAKSFDELRALVRDNPEQSRAVDQLDASYESWSKVAASMITGTGQADTSSVQVAAKQQIDGIRSGFSGFIAVEEALRQQRTTRVARMTRLVIASSLFIAVLVGIVVGIATRKYMRSLSAEFEHALTESEHERARAEAAEREMRSLYGEAQSANRAKDEFLATLSHELRTPLTAILGWSRLLQMQEPDLDENVSNALQAIEHAAKTQAALVDDILDVSRVITGKLKLDIRTVNMADVVRRAVESIGPAAAAKSIAICLDMPSDVPLHGDANRLQQIIWNLISNAVKFSPRGSRVTVTVEPRVSEIVLTVRDEGRGIEPDFLPFVFERFRQADSSTTREYGGLGIGLSVVKLLVEMHGGRVEAASDGEGKGSTFTVTFPAPADQNRSHAVRATDERDLEARLQGRDVLVVDDDEEARKVMAAVLAQFGARIVAASSAAEAVAHLETREFALVVTDIAMPGEDGLTLARRVRRNGGRNSGVPMVAVTALAASEASGSGFAAVLQKPVDPVDLATAAAAALG